MSEHAGELDATTGTGTAQGDEAMAPPVEVTVAICTFRRPVMLARLLARLEQLQFSGPVPRVGVLVVDNAPEGGADAVVERARREGVLPIDHRHLGAGNIALARNAALEAVPESATFVALVDDDEVPDPWWLDELLRTATETGADMVFGPALPTFPDDAPRWARRDELFATTGFPDRGELDEGATNNALLRTATVRRLGLSFDPALGASGGEDQLFTRQAKHRGAELRWAASAVVHEEIPAARLSHRYLGRREYRKGNTLGLLDRGGPGWPPRRPVRRLASAAYWTATGLGSVLRGALRRDHATALDGALRVARAAGMVVGLVGRRYDLYAGAAGVRREHHPTVAFVTSESPYYQASGASQFLRGFVQHYARGRRPVLLVVTSNRVGFLVRRADADGVRVVAPGLRRIGSLDVVVDPRAVLATAAWAAFRMAPRPLQRAVDAVRNRARSSRGTDHHLGSLPTTEEAAWIASRLAHDQPEAVLFWTLWSVPEPLELPASVRATCLLTSDIMWQRAEAFRQQGYRTSPESFSAEEERALLAKVPLLVAIQWDDAEELSRLVPTADVVVSPVAVTPPPPVVRRPRPDRCLFVGSGALHNVDGLRWFLEECWPSVHRRRPDAELHVVGTVCARIGPVPPGVVLRGEVDDLVAEYARAAVAVVPLRVGSGLKVKIVEAMCHGLAVVTTPVGAQGLLSLEPRPFALADDGEHFADEVVTLLQDSRSRARLEHAAGEQAALFSPDRVYQDLDRHLRERGVRLPEA